MGSGSVDLEDRQDVEVDEADSAAARPVAHVRASRPAGVCDGELVEELGEEGLAVQGVSAYPLMTHR